MDIIGTTLYTLFAFIIVLSVLVFVHEYGHYLACVWLKIRVASFSIGMGKEIKGWTDKRGVRWRISMLPIGGYVMMYGDADASSGTADKNLLSQITEEEKAHIIYFQPSWKKFIVTIMGPTFNMIFAILLFAGIYMTNGISNLRPVIDGVQENSPAYGVFEKGDVVLKINDKKIATFSQISNEILIGNGKEMSFKILRNDEEIDINITPQEHKTEDAFGNPIDSFYLGIASEEVKKERVGIFSALYEATKTTYKMCENTMIILGQMITGNRNTDGLGGPIKIAKYSAQSFDGGIIMVIYFMAMLSTNLGFMNLLPIPVLDGGALFFLIIEMITRRQIPEKVQNKFLQIGFGLLIFLMAFVTLNDIRGLFK